MPPSAEHVASNGLRVAALAPRACGADWGVGISAAVLLLIAVGGYWYHRDQLEEIAAEHPRAQMVGPASLVAGSPARYVVRSTTITGRPLPAELEFALLGADGRPILHRVGHTGDEGRLSVAIPASAKLPLGVCRVEVLLRRGQSEVPLAADVAVRPQGYVTYLTTDRPSYTPGETVHARSVTLSRYGRRARREFDVAYELRDASGELVWLGEASRSSLVGATRRGVGWTQFTLPNELAAGEYTIVAVQPDGQFPAARRRVTVQPADVSLDGDIASPPERKLPPIHPATRDRPIVVEFFPEGGTLVAGLENRVYFTARDASGRPAEIRGLVVNADDQGVAMLETTHDGRGAFSITPRPGERYRLRILPDNGQPIEHTPALPEVDTRQNVVLSTGLGVFAAERPLEFNIRASEDAVPLVAVVSARGATVAEQPVGSCSPRLVVAHRASDDGSAEGALGAGGVNPVRIELPDDLGGVLRLALFDYSINPPRLVAERLVYRRSPPRLDVEATIAEHDEVGADSAAPHGPIELALRCRTEQGEPVAAVAGIRPLMGETPGEPDSGQSEPPSMWAFFQLSSELAEADRPADPDFYLDDRPDARVALDLLLGTSRPVDEQPGWRLGAGDAGRASPEPQAPSPEPRAPSPEPSPDAPMVWDNLDELQQRYQDTLDEYRQSRTHSLNALTTSSFFAALALVLAVAMLGLLGIVAGLRLWIPAVGAAVCCLLIGAIIYDPLKVTADAPHATPMMSHHPPPADTPGPLDGNRSGDPTPQHLQGHPRGSAHLNGSRPAELAPFELPAADATWQPFIEFDADGRATVPLGRPNQGGVVRLRIDAHGDGRIGGGRVKSEE